MGRASARSARWRRAAPAPVVGGRRRQADRRQRIQRGLQRRIRLHDDAVLVGLRVDRRDDALTEQIVQRVVHGRRRDAEARGGRRGRSPGSPSAPAAADRWRRWSRSGNCCSRASSFGTHSLNADRLGFSSTNWYCVRLIAASIVRSCTGCRYSDTPATSAVSCCSRRPICGGVQAALVLWLQVDQEAAAVQRRVAAVDADERTDADDVGIFQDRRRQRLLMLRHGAVGRWSARRPRCPGSSRYPAPERSPSARRYTAAR